MNDEQRRTGKERRNRELDGEPLNDEHQARNLEPINPDENTMDEVLYGGEESDFDREYWDNPDEHEYYDRPERGGYHPDAD